MADCHSHRLHGGHRLCGAPLPGGRWVFTAEGRSVGLEGVSNRPTYNANPTAIEFADDHQNSPLRRPGREIIDLQRARSIQVEAYDWPKAPISSIGFFAERPVDGHEIRAPDMHGGMGRDHLQFYGDQPQMFDGAGGADASVAYRGEWLAGPFVVGLIERVLENAGDRLVVFRDHEYLSVAFADRLLPADGFRILARHP
jgi:hypothetical protein